MVFFYLKPFRKVMLQIQIPLRAFMEQVMVHYICERLDTLLFSYLPTLLLTDVYQDI